jgi:hypothetical protein
LCNKQFSKLKMYYKSDPSLFHLLLFPYSFPEALCSIIFQAQVILLHLMSALLRLCYEVYKLRSFSNHFLFSRWNSSSKDAFMRWA